MKSIDVQCMTGPATLAGRAAGVRDLPKLLTSIEDSPQGSTVLLDWSGIEVATASYFAAALVPLLRLTMTGGLDRYLILSGLNETCLDELKLALDTQGLVVLLGDCGKDGTVESLRLFGKLDPVYIETFADVQGAKRASASELQAKHASGRSRIGKTGWINRLSNLHRLRLVKKQKIGRQFLFMPVTEEG